MLGKEWPSDPVHSMAALGEYCCVMLMQAIHLSVAVYPCFNGSVTQIKPSIDQKLDCSDSSQHYTHHWIKEQELFSSFIPRMMIKSS